MKLPAENLASCDMRARASLSLEDKLEETRRVTDLETGRRRGTHRHSPPMIYNHLIVALKPYSGAPFLNSSSKPQARQFVSSIRDNLPTECRLKPYLNRDVNSASPTHFADQIEPWLLTRQSRHNPTTTLFFPLLLSIATTT